MRNKIFLILFMTIWISLVILNFIIKNKEFSEQENRYLAKFPKITIEKLVNGNFQDSLNTYINDHFVFRDMWVKLNSEKEKLLGKKENNGIYIGKDGYLFEKIEYTEKEKKHLDKILDIINKFSNNIEIPIYLSIVPNSIYIHQDKLPNNAQTINQKELIENFYNKLNSKINTVDTVGILLENKDKYIFFKTDHHITSLGAYFAYSQIMSEMGVNFSSIEEFEKKTVSQDFLGTFDSKAQIFKQEKDKIDIYVNENNINLKSVEYDEQITKSIYNEDFLSKKDKYSYFLNSNNSKVVVKTNITNGKKLLVIKDSYAHIFAQFLCQNFEEIHFIDPRYYKLSISEYAVNNEITEILFLYNTSNLLTDLGILSVH